jgi:hypothetical protein
MRSIWDIYNYYILLGQNLYMAASRFITSVLSSWLSSEMIIDLYLSEIDGEIHGQGDNVRK